MKNTSTRIDPRALEAKAGEVADLLRALANDRRLLILCKLVETGEATVGSLAEDVGLSQSALSQHLARMRDEGIVAYSLRTYDEVRQPKDYFDAIPAAKPDAKMIDIARKIIEQLEGPFDPTQFDDRYALAVLDRAMVMPDGVEVRLPFAFGTTVGGAVGGGQGPDTGGPGVVGQPGTGHRSLPQHAVRGSAAAAGCGRRLLLLAGELS